MRKGLILFLMGGWLGGTLLMWGVAIRNFQQVDVILLESRPELEERIEPLREGHARQVLRLLASELNRFYFHAWGIAQLVLGIVILVLLWLPPRNLRTGIPVVLMWGLSAGLLFLLTPRLVELGRSIDFVPRTPSPPEMPLFWRLHLTYTLADAAKFGLGIWTFFRIVNSGIDSRRPSEFSN